MTIKFSRCLARTILFVALVPCDHARAQTRIAHTSQGFTSFHYAVLNNAGEVCFSATKINGAGHAVVGVYKGSGGGVTTVLENEIAAPAGELVPLGGELIAMNDAGLVALVATGFFGNQPYVYATRGMVTQPADLIVGFQQVGSQPSFSINNNSYLGSGGILLQLDSNGNRNPLYDQCRNCFGLLNNNNQLLIGTLDFVTGDTRIFRVDVGVVEVNPISGIKTLGPTSTNLITSVDAATAVLVAMNDSGTVAYYGTETNGTPAIFKTSGGAGVPFVEFRDPNAPPGTGPDLNQVGEYNFAINNSGQIAFLARSRLLDKVAIFRGSNALTDKIVASGDIVAGSQIDLGAGGLFGTGHWFNDAGQVVFKAFDDTGEGLWLTGSVASPPPQNPTPTSRFEWNPESLPPPMPPNGSFGDTDNWVPLDGTMNRVPEKTSTHADVAIFDRAEEYSVSLDNLQHAEQLLVKNGHVTFRSGGGLKVDALSFEEPSMLVNNARLTLSFLPDLVSLTPVITCNHALIGGFGAARVDVVTNAQWLANGSLRVGGPGEGILTINTGGEVTSGEARIGTGVGGGNATVGKNGSWKTGNIAIGAGGKGELTIAEGGHVESGAAVIGQDAGAGGGLGNKVVVDASSWSVASLLVGDAATGRLEVKNGAEVDAGILQIAKKAGVTGAVTVSGVDADSEFSRLFCARLETGEAGSSELRIEDGALVNAENVLLGAGTGDTTVTVTGIHGGTINSKLNVAEDLFVGDLSNATFLMESGGAVHSKNAKVTGSYSRPRASEVRIDGASSWDLDEKLTVGSLAGLELGSAVVTLLGGAIEAQSIEVNNKGRIQGFGTLAVAPANRLLNGGTISPGLSPGTLTISGNYEQGPGGRLLVEIGGTNSADYDHLIITNTATLGGNVTFKFISGFAPKAGDHFDFLSVGGTFNDTFATVGLQNLAPGFQFKFVTNGPLLCMTALNGGVFDPSPPGQVDVTLTNVGGLTYATYVLTTTNSCQRITPDGAFTRTSNVFSQAFQGTTLIGGGCTDQAESLTNTVLLGALPPGEYSFRILANTQTVQTLAFTVPPNVIKTLRSAGRLPDGSVQLQIDGLSPTAYTIEASEDLQSWIKVGSGTLPDTFTDPDAAIFRTRFYRARMEP